jgi:hypothetical protein
MHRDGAWLQPGEWAFVGLKNATAGASRFANQPIINRPCASRLAPALETLHT